MTPQLSEPFLLQENIVFKNRVLFLMFYFHNNELKGARNKTNENLYL